MTPRGSVRALACLAMATVAAAGLVAESTIPGTEDGAQDDRASLFNYARCLHVQDVDEFLEEHRAKASALLNADDARIWMHLTHALKLAKHLTGKQVAQVVARARGTLAL